MENKRLPRLCDKLICTGCASCYSICPKNAITMTAGTDGFLYPSVNPDKCIGCLACEKACPVINPSNPKNNSDRPKTFACWNLDKQARWNSSSGGAFSALAKTVYEQGGCVVGAAYDSEMYVRHLLTDSEEDLTKLRGSKYVQSDIGDTFRQVKERLTKGTTVLFVGTPCQIAGLRAFLKKDYPNLYCCDFICHGTPSPLLFKKYVQWIENSKNISVSDFNFRHKKSGWYDALRAANGNSYMKGKYDAYFLGFNRNLTLRESCYQCPAIGLPRKGDLTIADFWGIGMMYKFDESNEIHNGVSLVMINNDKGEALFEMAKGKLNWRKGSFDEALNRNKPMIKPSQRPRSRDSFYADMQTMDFESLREKYLSLTGKAKLIAWLRENAPRTCVTGLRNIVQMITWRRNGSKSLQQ